MISRVPNQATHPLARQLITEFSTPRELVDEAKRQATLEQLGKLPDAERSTVFAEVSAELGTDKFDSFKADYEKAAQEVIGAQLALQAYLASQKLVAGAGATAAAEPIDGAAKATELRAAEAASRKKVPVAHETSSVMDAAELIHKGVADLEREVSAAGKHMTPQQAKKLQADLNVYKKLTENLPGATARLGMSLDALDRKLSRAAEAQATAPAFALPPNYSLEDLSRMSTAAGNTQGLSSMKTLEKMANQIKDTSRSAHIMGLINSNLPIESVLVAVMLLFLEDSDEELRRKMKEAAEKSQSMTTLRKQRIGLENAKLGDLRSMFKTDAAEKAKAAKAPTDDKKTDAAPAPAAAPATTAELAQQTADTIREAAIAEGAAEALEAKSEALSPSAGSEDSSDIVEGQIDDQKKERARKTNKDELEAQLKAAQAKARLGGKGLDQAKVANAPKDPAAAAPVSDTEATKTAAAAPAEAASISEPKAEPEAEPTPHELEEWRMTKLRELHGELQEGDGSMSALNVEVQAAMEKRKMMLDMLSKLLGEITQMAQAVSRNIGR